jgi:hypothetical protein
MKLFLSALASITAAFFLAGCGDSNSSTATSTNAADINNPLVNAKRTADKTADAAALNQAIQLFNVQEGRYPKDLQELTPKYIRHIPDAPLGYKISYDAKKGEVSVMRE